MKITFKGDYALKAMLDLSCRHETGMVTPLIDISKRQNIPEKYLEQIMLILKKAGYIDSRRGSGGGFFLLKQPDQIFLGEIIRLIEGPVEPIACAKVDHDGSCGEENECAFREVWLSVTDAISHVVDGVTLSNIMQRTTEIKEQKKAHYYEI